MGNVTLSISNPNTEDTIYFRSLATKTKPLNVVFSELVAAHRGTAPVNVSSSEVENNQALIEENITLKESLQAAETQNQTHLDTIEALNSQLSTLNSQLSTLNAQKITAPSYIFTPNTELFNHMRRYFALLRKQGKITTETPDLPQTLTAKAITYLFKNEYPEVIK